MKKIETTPSLLYIAYAYLKIYHVDMLQNANKLTRHCTNESVSVTCESNQKYNRISNL